MKRLLVTLVFCISLFSSSGVMAQTVSSLTMTFATTGDDKASTTQVRDRVILNGRDLAYLFCCDRGQELDHWHHHSTHDLIPMKIVGTLSKTDLDHATFELGMSPAGSDTWIFVATLHAVFNSGPDEQWTFPETMLNCNNCAATKTFPLTPSQ
jgi:hypothetical protein